MAKKIVDMFRCHLDERKLRGRMKILAIDTSSEACSVALLKSDLNASDEIKSLHRIAPMQQARLLLPMIQELLHSSSLMLSDLDAIAYGCGPGSFTGIRIASSVAQGIGLAAQLRIIPISSLAGMAQAAFLKHHWSNLLVAVDARVQQIYCAAYKANVYGIVELVGQEMVVRPEEISPSLSDIKYYGIGSGWKLYEKQLVRHLGIKPCAINFSQVPEASAMLTLAKIQLEKGNHVSVSEAVPVYLR